MRKTTQDGIEKQGEPSPGVLKARSLRWARRVAPPLSVYVAQISLQLIFLALMTKRSGASMSSSLLGWDAKYYATIATQGYSYSLKAGHPGVVGDGSTLAFFPLYPMLCRALSGLTGMSAGAAQLSISVLSGAVAYVAIYQTCRALEFRRFTGLVACGLVGAGPMFVIFQLGYADALTVALTALVIYSAVRRQWAWCAVAGVLCGLCRPSAFLVCFAVALLIRRTGEWRKTNRHKVLAGLATVAPGLGAATYICYVGWRTGGGIGAWFRVQKDGWGTSFDGGSATFTAIRDGVFKPASDSVTQTLAAFIILSFIAVFVVACSRRENDVFTPSAFFFLVFTLGSSNYWHSKPRLLMGVLPFLVIPLANELTMSIRRRALVVFVVAASVFSSWFGAYLVEVWPYAI